MPVEHLITRPRLAESRGSGLLPICKASGHAAVIDSLIRSGKAVARSPVEMRAHLPLLYSVRSPVRTNTHLWLAVMRVLDESKRALRESRQLLQACRLYHRFIVQRRGSWVAGGRKSQTRTPQPSIHAALQCSSDGQTNSNLPMLISIRTSILFDFEANRNQEPHP